MKSKKKLLLCRELFSHYSYDSLQKQQIDMIEKNKKLQKKLEEILPESIKDEGRKKDENNFIIVVIKFYF